MTEQPQERQATANQLATISKLHRLLYGSMPDTLPDTRDDASKEITRLSREYNERKGWTR